MFLLIEWRRRLSCAVQHPAEIADGFRDAGQRVVHVLFVLQAADPAVFDLTERAHERRDINRPARQLDPAAFPVRRSHVLEMDIVQPIREILDGLHGVLAVPELMADVQAEPDPFIHVLDDLDGAFGIGEQLRHVGTLKSEVARISKKGQNILFDIDVVGGSNIKKYYGDNALAVFVQAPSIEELKNRLIIRSTDHLEVIQQRIAKAEHEMSFVNLFDIVIVNDKLEDALLEAEQKVIQFLEKNSD